MKMDGDGADSLKPQHTVDDKCVNQPPFRWQPKKININKQMKWHVSQLNNDSERHKSGGDMELGGRAGGKWLGMAICHLVWCVSIVVVGMGHM